MDNVFIKTLAEVFERNADPEVRVGKEAYMRHRFSFYGITAPKLKKISQPFYLKEYLPEKDEMTGLVKMLWQKPEREYQYFAQELAFKYARCNEKSDIRLFEYMGTHKSWWDTVDFIASKLIGTYFLRFPELIPKTIPTWLESGNIWLQRSALIFQLKYKGETDTSVLSNSIEALLGSQEFFINKAIGWALREYSKTNPEWVDKFVAKTELSNLSKREALRLIN